MTELFLQGEVHLVKYPLHAIDKAGPVEVFSGVDAGWETNRYFATANRSMEVYFCWIFPGSSGDLSHLKLGDLAMRKRDLMPMNQ